jgi:hypothetical protein
MDYSYYSLGYNPRQYSQFEDDSNSNSHNNSYSNSYNNNDNNSNNNSYYNSASYQSRPRSASLPSTSTAPSSSQTLRDMGKGFIGAYKKIKQALPRAVDFHYPVEWVSLIR